MTERSSERVLVCDDDVVQRRLLQEMLRRLGYACDTAVHGREALDLLGRHGYALLITDIFMAEMDGIELVREMRRQGSQLPVVAISGGFRGVLRPYRDFMTAMGAVAVIEKPFSSADLAAALATALGGSSPGGSSPGGSSPGGSSPSDSSPSDSSPSDSSLGRASPGVTEPKAP